MHLYQIFLLICFFSTTYSYAEPPSSLSEAEISFIDGNAAKTIAEREKAFNRTLTLLTELEGQYTPHYGTGKLYFNIGNTYSLLEQYPLALFYFYRAQLLMPREKAIQSDIDLALAKLALEKDKQPSTFGWLFSFHHHFSLPERLQGLFLFSIIAFLATSVYIWWHWKWSRHLALASAIVVFILLCSVCYTRYFSPIEGVIIHPSLLQREAGSKAVLQGQLPLLPGQKVRILEILQDGHWMKVITEERYIGYLPDSSLEIL